MANFIFCDEKFINTDRISWIEILADQGIIIHMVGSMNIVMLPDKANEFLKKSDVLQYAHRKLMKNKSKGG